MSGSHILLLAVILVIFILGPRSLPQLGRSLGDAIRGFKKGMSGEDDDELDVTGSASEKLQSSRSTESETTKRKEKDKV